MDYNEELASLIKRADPTADWVYNYHCKFCAKFLYPEEIKGKCKKCKTIGSSAMLRAIPFTTSATAIEKLIDWANKQNRYLDLKQKIYQSMTSWITGKIDSIACKSEIVAAAIGAARHSDRDH